MELFQRKLRGYEGTLEGVCLCTWYPSLFFIQFFIFSYIMYF